MYDLEVPKIIHNINENSLKLVLLQFPDGLKIQSREVVQAIEKETTAKCVVWFGSCFGACDLPDFSRLEIDLFVAFGHNIFTKEWDDR